MKSWVIATLVLLLSLGCQKMNDSKNIVKALNVPIPSAVNFKKIDGKKIVTAIQYQLLINLNLTLLEYDKNANLVTLLAEDFDINDREIIFKIRKGVKTISGHEVKAKDAEVSLKRLIASNDGSHSRLADLLCSEDAKEISNRCPGVSSQNYELKITARKKSYIPFVLSLLTNADNVIMPLTALDSTLPESTIVNFRETSGPYYLDIEKNKDEGMDKFKLSLNEKHFLNDGKLASEVNYSVVEYNNILNKDYNYFHSVVGLKLETIKEIEEHHKNLNCYPTVLIKNTIIYSTNRGREMFSSKELIRFALKIKNLLLNSVEYYPNIKQTQISYFPSESDGNLREDQMLKVVELYDSLVNQKNTIKRKIRVGVYNFLFEKYKIAFQGMDDIEIVKIASSPLDKNSENVDLYISTIDSSFTESLDLLQYNKTFGIFDVTDEDMKNYIDADSKEVRIKLLQDIHFKSLMEGRFVIIGTAPYYTVLSNDWVAGPPKFFVGFPVWKIKRKN